MDCIFCESFAEALENAMDDIDVLREENTRLKKRIFKLIMEKKAWQRLKIKEARLRKQSKMIQLL